MKQARHPPPWTGATTPHARVESNRLHDKQSGRRLHGRLHNRLTSNVARPREATRASSWSNESATIRSAGSDWGDAIDNDGGLQDGQWHRHNEGGDQILTPDFTRIGKGGLSERTLEGGRLVRRAPWQGEDTGCMVRQVLLVLSWCILATSAWPGETWDMQPMCNYMRDHMCGHKRTGMSRGQFGPC